MPLQVSISEFIKLMNFPEWSRFRFSSRMSLATCRPEPDLAEVTVRERKMINRIWCMLCYLIYCFRIQRIPSRNLCKAVENVFQLENCRSQRRAFQNQNLSYWHRPEVSQEKKLGCHQFQNNLSLIHIRRCRRAI